MKTTFTLTHQVALWLGLNLALLVFAGVGFMVWRYGVGWPALVAGPAGEHLRSVSSVLTTELRNNPAQDLEALLQEHQPGRTELALFVRQDELIAGRRFNLPAAVHAELIRRPPPNSAEPDLAGAGPSHINDNPRKRDPIHRPPTYFFMHPGNTGPFWLGLRMPVPDTNDGLQPGTLMVRIPSALDLLLLLEFGPWFAAVGVAFLLSVLCWLPFATGLRRNLIGLAKTTEKLAEGRFDTRVNITRRDELGALGVAVNRMAERLDQHAQNQKRFLGDVAIELGSPLARLQVAIELLERRAGPELQTSLGDVRDEVQQIAALVNELLAFTKAGLRPREISLVPVELAPLLQSVIDREGALGRVECEVPDQLHVLADQPLLERALGNLVRNALRYGGRDGKITVAAQTDGDSVVITVTDEGPGVPPEALARLGEPFFRPETARTRETGGVGLGLAIVRSAVTACAGSVRFTNREPSGFAAEVTLSAV